MGMIEEAWRGAVEMIKATLPKKRGFDRDDEEQFSSFGTVENFLAFADAHNKRILEQRKAAAGG